MKRLVVTCLLTVALIVGLMPTSQADTYADPSPGWANFLTDHDVTQMHLIAYAAFFLDNTIGTNWRTASPYSPCHSSHLTNVDELPDLDGLSVGPTAITLQEFKDSVCDIDNIDGDLFVAGEVQSDYVCQPGPCHWEREVPNQTQVLNAQDVFEFYFYFWAAFNDYNARPGDGESAAKTMDPGTPHFGVVIDLPSAYWTPGKIFLDAHTASGVPPVWEKGMGLATTTLSVEPSGFQSGIDDDGGYLWNYGASGWSAFRPHLNQLGVANQRWFIWEDWSTNKPVGMVLGTGSVDRADFVSDMAATELGNPFVVTMMARSWCYVLGGHGAPIDATVEEQQRGIFMPDACWEYYWNGENGIGLEILPPSSWLKARSKNVTGLPFPWTFTYSYEPYRDLRPGDVPPPAWKDGVPTSRIKVTDDLAPPIEY